MQELTTTDGLVLAYYESAGCAGATSARAHDPALDGGGSRSMQFGVAYWRGDRSTPARRRRIFLGTLDAHLIALDAATGAPCADFGNAGTVDLLAGLTPVVDPWQ